MQNKKLWLALAFVVALFVVGYYSNGLKFVINQSVMVALLWIWFPVIRSLVKRHDVHREYGWKILGPSLLHWGLATIPIFVAIDVVLVVVIDHFVFGDPLYFGSIVIFYDMPVLNLFVFLPCLYGIIFGWVWRLRWNELGIERRNIFFQKRWIAWSDIVSVSRWNWHDVIVAKLLDGSHVFVSPSRAGFAELEKDARRMNIAIDHDH